MNNHSEVVHLDSASITVDNQVLLKDIHLQINKGEFCYLKGETGSGKSSLIKALYGLLPMEGARLYVAGHDLTELTNETLPKYRQSLGLISEIYPIFLEDTVFKNMDRILHAIDWAIASEREKRINEVLDQIGLDEVKSTLVRDLPSGQRQKVSIARSVLNRPSLILADNPMVHLDEKSTEEVMSLFINIVKDNKTSVLCIVSDDQLMNRYPSRSYFCGDGTITESR